MTQAVPELKTLWRLMKSSFSVLIEDFEENPGKFGIEGVRSLRHVIDCLLLDPQGFHLPAWDPAGPVPAIGISPHPTSNKTDPTTRSTQEFSNTVAKDSINGSLLKEQHSRQDLQHAVVSEPSIPAKQRVASKAPAEEVEHKRGYEPEEHAYIAAAWHRVMSGEIGRPECAAEVTDVLGRTKASIQGQFTWLKLSAIKAAKGKPRTKSTSGEETSVSGGYPAQSHYDVAHAMSGQKKRKARAPRRYRDDLFHGPHSEGMPDKPLALEEDSSPTASSHSLHGSKGDESGEEDWMLEPIVVSKKRYIDEGGHGKTTRP